jgi:aminotransferase
MARVKQLITGPAASVSQWAALAAITGPDTPTQEFHAIYAERRHLLMDGLRTMGFDFSDPRGAFFLWTNSASTGIHATELAYLLLKEGRVLIFPGTAFGDNWAGYLRISVLQPTDQLREAVARMKPIVERYRVQR